MRRLLGLLLLLAGVLPTGGALAFSPEGGTAEITDFGGGHGLSLGLFGLEAPQRHATLGETPAQSGTLALEMSWARGGFWAALSAGQERFVPGGADVFVESSYRFIGVRVGHDFADVLGGVLSVQFSGFQYSEATATSAAGVPELGFRLGWSMRF